MPISGSNTEPGAWSVIQTTSVKFCCGLGSISLPPPLSVDGKIFPLCRLFLLHTSCPKYPVSHSWSDKHYADGKITENSCSTCNIPTDLFHSSGSSSCFCFQLFLFSYKDYFQWVVFFCFFFTSLNLIIFFFG